LILFNVLFSQKYSSRLKKDHGDILLMNELTIQSKLVLTITVIMNSPEWKADYIKLDGHNNVTVKLNKYS
jgi:hypothetical protein